MGVSEGEETMLEVHIKASWKISKSDKRPQHTNSRCSANSTQDY